jgi:hypothetical protein
LFFWAARTKNSGGGGTGGKLEFRVSFYKLFVGNSELDTVCFCGLLKLFFLQFVITNSSKKKNQR